jgi:hypothetical protein
MTIKIPELLSRRLADEAYARQITVDQLAIELLNTSLLNTPTESTQDDLIRLVERIKASPGDPNSIHPAKASLYDLMRLPHQKNDDDDEPPLSPEEWDQLWANFEANEKELTRLHDLADGLA